MINVSVIIPTYKRTQETLKCVDLLSKSTGLNEDLLMEILVFDSSPTSELEAMLNRFDEMLKINYLHTADQTLPGRARNIAVEKASNELIISLDSDIEFKRETAQGLISFMRNHPRVARATGVTKFSSGEKKGKKDRPTKWDRIYRKYDTNFIEGIYGRYEIFYKTAFQNINGYDEIFEFCGEGTDISVRFWRDGYPLAIAKDVLAYHNSEAPESLRRSVSDKMQKMYLSLFLVAYKYDVTDINKSLNFVYSHREREKAYGDTLEFHSVVSAAKAFEWIRNNYVEIEKSKKKIPNLFDFKPFDVFTDEYLINECLEKSKNKLNPLWERVFGENS